MRSSIAASICKIFCKHAQESGQVPNLQIILGYAWVKKVASTKSGVGRSIFDGQWSDQLLISVLSRALRHFMLEHREMSKIVSPKRAQFSYRRDEPLSAGLRNTRLCHRRCKLQGQDKIDKTTCKSGCAGIVYWL